MKPSLTHLERLEAEAIFILREGVANAQNPVMLFSAGKDSTVLAHLALRAFFPAPPPFPLLHVDSTWEFQALLDFRDAFARQHGFSLLVWTNESGRAEGLNPVDHGDAYTTIMRTDALKQALDRGRYDVIFGGARRDEEKSRAKERVFSVRGKHHGWEPRQQRPELWQIYNTRLGQDQTLRIFPLSNWTEIDIWTYALVHDIALAPLYFAQPRPVVGRGGALIVVVDPARSPFGSDTPAVAKTVRFRTLGCWPVTAAVESDATDLSMVVWETITAAGSERQGRIADRNVGGSLERQKRDGYF